MQSNTGNTDLYIVKVRNAHTGRWRTVSYWGTLEAAELEAARVYAGHPKAIFKGRKKLHNVARQPGELGRMVRGLAGRSTAVRTTAAERAAAVALSVVPPYSRIGEVAEPMRSLLVELINAVAAYDSRHYVKLRQLVKGYEDYARRELVARRGLN